MSQNDIESSGGESSGESSGERNVEEPVSTSVLGVTKDGAKRAIRVAARFAHRSLAEHSLDSEDSARAAEHYEEHPKITARVKRGMLVESIRVQLITVYAFFCVVTFGDAVADTLQVQKIKSDCKGNNSNFGFPTEPNTLKEVEGLGIAVAVFVSLPLFFFIVGPYKYTEQIHTRYYFAAWRAILVCMVFLEGTRQVKTCILSIEAEEAKCACFSILFGSISDSVVFFGTWLIELHAFRTQSRKLGKRQFELSAEIGGVDPNKEMKRLDSDFTRELRRRVAARVAAMERNRGQDQDERNGGQDQDVAP